MDGIDGSGMNSTDAAEGRLYGLMELVERQQAAAQAALDGMAAERAALRRERDALARQVQDLHLLISAGSRPGSGAAPRRSTWPTWWTWRALQLSPDHKRLCANRQPVALSVVALTVLLLAEQLRQVGDLEELLHLSASPNADVFAAPAPWDDPAAWRRLSTDDLCCFAEADCPWDARAAARWKLDWRGLAGHKLPNPWLSVPSALATGGSHSTTPCRSLR